MIQTENGPQKLTWDQVQAKKKRRETTHVVVTDDDAAKALRISKSALAEAERGFPRDQDRVDAAKALVEEAETEVRASALVFRLRAMPRQGDGSFAVLKAEHPPTDEDSKRFQESSGDPKAKAAWHADTFYPALVAASLIEPEVTADQAAEWSQEWNDAEWTALWLAALDVNQAATDTGGLTFS